MKTEIAKCISVLEQGGTLLYPSDTLWGIGCDATDPVAVEQVFRIKQRPDSKSLIVLLPDISLLEKYITADVEKASILLADTSRPTTVIYPGARNLAMNVIASDMTVAIRIVKEGFCHALLAAYGKPLVSTSANISGQPAPPGFSSISPALLRAVDYTVDERFGNQIQGMPSKIIRLLENGTIQIIRD